MFTSNERGIRKQAQVDFTRSGWRQFFKLNRSLGARFIRGFVLRHELAAYLTAHEAAGVELDEGCQEVCYENGVYLLLRKMQGVWYITDIFAAEETVAYVPLPESGRWLHAGEILGDGYSLAWRVLDAAQG